MNEMECELVTSSHVYQLRECHLETAFSFQVEDILSPDTIQDYQMLDQGFLEGLHQPDSDLIDFDASIHIDAMASKIGVTEQCHDHEGDLRSQENEHLLIEENSYLKGIQAELMEETGLPDLLLTGAEAVESQNWSFASSIIDQLYHVLAVENRDTVLNRLAFFFTKGLYYKSINNTLEVQYHPVTGHTKNTWSAFQILQELSPYAKFAHFTANQAILEATEGDREVHVIDLDIMEGMQWPSLMVDLAMRRETILRVTAITVDQKSAQIAQQTGRRLKEFAASINFPFMFDQIMIVKAEDFQRIEADNHTIIVNCMIHQWMPNRSFSLVKTFLDGISRLSPKLVVLVEEELFNISKVTSLSFVEFFCEALHHYTALSDSLASSFWGGYNMKLNLIEKEILGIRIIDSVSQFPCGNMKRNLWEEGFYFLNGFKRVSVSSCNISQANFLVTLFGGGYGVQYENRRLTLCWKSRPLTAASVWASTTYLTHKVK